MSESVLPPLIIVAHVPDALTDLCGVSLLERLRRIVRQIGFGEATILSNSSESVAAHVAMQTWRRADVSLSYRQQQSRSAVVGDILGCLAAMNVRRRIGAFVAFAHFYCDPRLLRALAHRPNDTAIVDSDPPPMIAPLWKNAGGSPSCAAVLSNEWLSGKEPAAELSAAIGFALSNDGIALLDAAQQDGYVKSMRRIVRPIFFPAPNADLRPLAERVLMEATQNGVLDLPALAHAPIEKWIVAHLCRTAITPNQITLLTGLVGVAVTFLYAAGYLWTGALLALAIGVLDGVDGKLARVKVQTTKLGKAEHTLDLFIEMSWWAALAYHFVSTGQLHYAYSILIGFYASHFLARLARDRIQRRIGRSLDDFAPFDRLVRSVAGRRNIYTWLFTLSLLLGTPATGFVLLCSWGILSATVHICRSIQIGLTLRHPVAATPS
ncbi:MAG TPA: CDP-alcohol phosphatidyltransferase family protein [Chthoniobacterales bacterium]|nr:CDP-alcohol phosphatidyltransferase family protein [Chthoniobacterales bacterium]